MNERVLNQAMLDSMALDEVNDPGRQSAYTQRFVELLDIIDDEGLVVGQAPRGLAHRLGLRHRTVFVMLRGGDGRLLLQRRGLGAGSSPMKLDCAVGGHVVTGEHDMRMSARREMEEELGLVPALERLVFVCEYNRTSPASKEKLHERNRERRFLFEYAIEDSEREDLVARFAKRFSRSEVSGVGWFAVDEVLDAVADGRAADGLTSSLLFWLRHRTITQ